MDPFSPRAVLVAASVATFLARRALKRQTLSRAGALAGFCVGFLIVATGLRGLVLLYFYQFASMATKYKKQLKQTLDASTEQASMRGASQVLCCSVLAVVLSLVHAYQCGAEKPIDFATQPLASRLSCAVLAHHATCLADSLASELGILSPSSPVLVTKPWRRVPPGTNGGVTLNGTLWSLVGGALIGGLTVAMDAVSGLSPLPLLKTTAFGALCGFTGSAIDSLLGATIQASYFDEGTKRTYQSSGHPDSAKHICGLDILTNEQVNLLSAVITTVLGGWVLGPWFYS